MIENRRGDVVYMNGIPPSPPIKKTPLVGVFFIGAEGEPLEVSASRGKGRLENPPGRLAPSGARRFNISPSPPIKSTTAMLWTFSFCYQRIFWGLGVRFEGKTGRFGFDGKRDANRLGDGKEGKWGNNGWKTCE
jgi:hypothetical protein